MIYVYRCDGGGPESERHVFEVTAPIGQAPAGPGCLFCGDGSSRYYKGERKQTNLGALKRELHGGMNASLVLPTAKQFEGPTDPDGSKGMQKWLDTFEPTSDNKRPAVPSMPAGTKKTYLTASSAKTKKKE